MVYAPEYLLRHYLIKIEQVCFLTDRSKIKDFAMMLTIQMLLCMG